MPNNSVACMLLVRMVLALYRVPAREHSDKRTPAVCSQVAVTTRSSGGPH
jgi:hypothetical protein